MGMEYMAKCDGCGTEFCVRDGGGFNFNLVRCNKCGDTKSVPITRTDPAIPPKRGNARRAPIDKCACGGVFGYFPPKCPNCGSTKYHEVGGGRIMYD